jgi:prophage tail gpP-like protein
MTAIYNPPKPVQLPIQSPLSELATLRVGNAEFVDWETVYVQTRWQHSWDYLRFTAAERNDDKVAQWPKLQIKPCDVVECDLAGMLVMTGVVVERQVAVDAQNHGVQLLAKGTTKWGYMSSVNTKTGSFDGMPFEAIFKKVLTPYLDKNGFEIVGMLNPIAFKKCQNQIGESCWDFLERLARVRGIVLGSNQNGDYVAVGNHIFPVAATLREGYNIKSMQLSINVDDAYVVYKAVGQKAGSDQSSGADTNEMEAAVGGTGCKTSILITPAEQPVDQPELQDRAKNEAKWNEAAKVTATVVVQGWQWAKGQLWRVGQSVWLDSPMGPINQKMKIQRCTYTQDKQNGTQTTLDLVQPWYLNDVDANLGTFAERFTGTQPTFAQIQQVAPTP